MPHFPLKNFVGSLNLGHTTTSEFYLYTIIKVTSENNLELLIYHIVPSQYFLVGLSRINLKIMMPFFKKS